ncbi:single-stranded DNA-binding protein [Campylobacter coli]|nr:single-stranded DNA-binding protein [Campylobacter coli]
MNKIILCGNLTKDIEMQYSQNGTAIAKTSIAINKKVKNEKQITFINCKLIGRLAEIANQYLSTGSKVLFEGELQISDYVDKDNIKRQWVEVIVLNMEMLNSNKNNKENNLNETSNKILNKDKNEVDLVEVDSAEDIPF